MPLFWLALVFSGALVWAADSPPTRPWSLAGLTVLSAAALWLASWSLRRWPLWADAPVRGLVSWLPPAWLQAWLRAWGSSARLRAALWLPAPWLLALAFGLGALRWALWLPDPAELRLPALAAAGQTALVQGWIARPPDERDTFTLLWLQVETARRPDDSEFYPLQEWLLVRAKPGNHWRYGERLEVYGQLSIPPEDELFSYRAYLGRQQVFSLLTESESLRLEGKRGSALKSSLYDLRSRVERLVYQYYPDPEAALLSGILLGLENGLSEEVQQAFQRTGAAHIIAISGFNLTLLVNLFFPLLRPLCGRWWGAALTAVMLSLYTLLTGADPSAQRAAWMGALALLGTQLGRQQGALNSLGLAGLLMVAFDPPTLWDAGFQLSFAAFFGLTWLGPPLQTAWLSWLGRWYPARPSLPGEAPPAIPDAPATETPPAFPKWARLLWEYLLLSLVVQIATLPVMLHHFGRLSLASIWVNPLILPVQPALMLAGGGSLLLGLLWTPLGQSLAALAWPFAVYTVRVVEAAAAMPGASWAAGNLPAGTMLLCYAGLLATPILLRRAGRLLRPGLMLAVLLALVVLAWQQAARAPDGLLHLTLLNSNSTWASGEAVLIQTPSGRHLLINGGPSPTALADELGRRLPYFQRRLDFLVVAGVKDNQLQALPPLVERFRPAQVLWAGESHAGRPARSLYQTVNELNIPLTQAASGQTLDLGDGAYLRILYAGPDGAALWLEWRNFRAFLPLGLDAAGREALSNDPLLAAPTVLILAGSGAEQLNPAAWVQPEQPYAILLSVAPADANGLPDPELLQRLHGANLLRTDQHGWIDLSSDGNQLWVTVERP